ncbi:MAG: phage shock protein PspC [Fusobacteria bacterium]|nr:MAG: phage shock protein PspC [Fusobacteriota bacterium]KAF0230133.1 MAG: phage shock protein [Fusobacteriota bacterium]
MKFYRKMQGSVLGGVCIGISEELKIDTMLFRLIAILSLIVSGGFVGLIYIILWAVLPAVDSNSNIKEEVMDKLNKHSFLKEKVKNPTVLGLVLVVFGLLILIDILLPMELIMKFIIPLTLVGAGLYLLIINNKK